MRAFSWNAERFWRPVLSRFARRVWKPHYVGFEHIPDSGACLIVANHVSYLDGLIIAAGCKRPVRFVIDGAIYRLPVVHYFMKHNRAIPILPNRESVTLAMQAVADGLAAGDAICLFPEGQLTYSGSLGRFRPGVEWILRKSPVPVIPIGLVGLWGSVFSRKYLRAPFRWWPREGGKIIVAVCGLPVPAEQITVNRLQREVLALKYQASTEQHRLQTGALLD